MIISVGSLTGLWSVPFPKTRCEATPSPPSSHFTLPVWDFLCQLFKALAPSSTQRSQLDRQSTDIRKEARARNHLAVSYYCLEIVLVWTIIQSNPSFLHTTASVVVHVSRSERSFDATLRWGRGRRGKTHHRQLPNIS